MAQRNGEGEEEEKAEQNDVMEEDAGMGDKQCDIKKEEKEKLLPSEQQQ